MRLYRILLNILTSLSRNATGLILGFIVTPLLLKYLGEEQFGAFRILLDLVGQLGLLELGLYTALLPIFGESFSDCSLYSPRTVAQQGTKKYFRVMGYQAIGLLVIYFFLDHLVPVSPENKDDLYIAFFIFGVNIPLILPRSIEPI